MLAPMSTTTTAQPLCVFCGHERPADQTRCSECGRPWIDIRVGSIEASVDATFAAGAATAANGSAAQPVSAPPPAPLPPVEESDPTGEIDIWDPPPKRKREWSMWAIPALLGAAVLAVYGLIFFGAFGSAPDTTVAAPAPTTTAVITTTTAPPATTAAPQTTTSSTTTTTTIPSPPPGSFAAAGNPITISDLKLQAGGLGPLLIGGSAGETIGRLVATLGEVDETGTDGIEPWVCDGTYGFWARWGELSVFVAGDGEEATFAGFRYRDPGSSATARIDIATPSGVRVGDDISTFEATYARYKISYEMVGGVESFQLLDGEELLLWGEVSSFDSTGRLVSIASPPLCETG